MRHWAHLHEDSSLTSIDYGLMVALLAVAVLTIVTSLWTWVSGGAG